MPIIQAKVIEGVFSDQQKKELIEKLTDAVVSVQGEGMRQLTYVLIEETKNEEWGIGGKPMTSEKVHEFAASGPASH